MTEKPQILFVDDEKGILDSIKVVLRKYRKIWEVLLASSMEEALEIVESNNIDILISDFRMPGKSGLDLLELIRKDHPNIIRIILTGQIETEQTIRSISTAQQFISKPIRSDELTSILERNVALLKYVDNPYLKKSIGFIGNLPSKTSTYNKLTYLLGKPTATITDMASVVEHDLAITAKILQIINSSFFGLVKEVTNIKTAVTLLGENVLRSIVLSEEVKKVLGTEKFPDGWSMNALHEHSIRSAIMASKIARTPAEKEQAFISGFLHDFGILIIACKFPDLFKEHDQLSKKRSCPISDVEYEKFGISHAEIGAYMLGLWGLPFDIIEAIAHHHTIMNYPMEELGLVDLVFLADIASKVSADDPGWENVFDERYEERLKKLSNKDEAIIAIDKLKSIISHGVSE